jgi:hypothetical protein
MGKRGRRIALALEKKRKELLAPVKRTREVVKGINVPALKPLKRH